MLSLANVHSGGRYLVVDETNGLLTASMVEKMDAQGMVMVVHENEHAALPIVELLNFSQEEQNACIYRMDLLHALHPEEDHLELRGEIAVEEDMDEKRRKAWHRKEERRKLLLKKEEVLHTGEFDALIVASTLDLSELVPLLLPKVAYGGNLVVYVRHAETLQEMHDVLTEREDLKLLGVDIHSNVVREWQIFSGRMHPINNHDSSGGLVYQGIRTLRNANVDMTTRRKKRRKGDDVREEDAAGGKKTKVDADAGDSSTPAL
jgi:tRNA (adenine-N(1)-)-methyltransferase non-catalytic subunit